MDDITPPTPPKKAKACKREQKYRPTWEQEKEFKDWLTPNRNDQYKAYCKVCAYSMKSERQENCCIANQKNMYPFYLPSKLNHNKPLHK